MVNNYKLYYTDTISYSHILQTPPCNYCHGHNAKVEIWIKSEETIKETGMVINFKDIKEILKKYDHRILLNSKYVKEPLTKDYHFSIQYDTLDREIDGLRKYYVFPDEDIVILHDMEPTVENLAEDIYDRVRKLSPSSTINEEFKIWKIKVRIWETEKGYCEYGD
jgi:6-pyruvoyl-tetrahydropterin synthase